MNTEELKTEVWKILGELGATWEDPEKVVDQNLVNFIQGYAASQCHEMLDDIWEKLFPLEDDTDVVSTDDIEEIAKKYIKVKE